MAEARSPILVAGAINTDLVATMNHAPRPGETVTGTSFAVYGGGKGANQAVAVARSGGNAVLLGAIGGDDFGRARLGDLERDGVGIAWVRRCRRESSGVALILVEDGGENRIAYVPGATRTVTADQATSVFEAVRPEFVLASNELPNETLLALFEMAREAQSTVVLNATPDPEMARDLLEAISILVVNEGEAAALLGTTQSLDPAEAVSQLRRLGPDTVVVTLGASGACAGNAEGVVRHQPPRVDVVDSTGAGDTFCGAFVTELVSGRDLDEALRFGVHASAISVTRQGAQASIPARAEVEASLAGEWW